MITIEGPGPELATDLATIVSGSISKTPEPPTLLTVGLLERALLARFPREDAEEWDRMGLLVGDPSEPVRGVCVALDPTKAAIRAAASLGANVLLTHHPVFLQPPTAFSPSPEVAGTAGANVWSAASCGVALMNFHTALDVSDEARRVYMGLLKFEYKGMLEPSPANESRGYGYLCDVGAAEGVFRLSHLAARCTSVFGRPPRVWGDLSQRIERVVFANGSANTLVAASAASDAQCLVCGEIGYHRALDATQAGLAVVELGHDASELPLVSVLAEAAVRAGVAPDSVHVLDQGQNWLTPDVTRLHETGVE